MRTLLSTTMRFSRVIGDEALQLAFRNPPRLRPARRTIEGLPGLFHFQASQPVEFLRREEYGHVAFLTTDHDRLMLRRVQEGSEVAQCVGGGNTKHDFYARQNARFRQGTISVSGSQPILLI